jgi:hypothetical protein
VHKKILKYLAFQYLRPMPYFLITVQVKDRKKVEAVREYPERDLEQVYLKLRYKANEKYGQALQYFNCVMISKNTAEVRAYVDSLGKKL